MPTVKELHAQTTLPVIIAPLFLITGVEMVVAGCKTGVIGTFPALNARTTEDFEAVVRQTIDSLATYQSEHPDAIVAPYAANLVLRNNPRLEADLAVCIEHKVPLIVTIMGKATQVAEAVHAYGGLVFSDVTTVEHARKAAACGVDGLVLVCGGAGGHAGRVNPFAFVPAVREFFDGAIVVAGCLSTGRGVRAVTALGADFAYMGTRFIPTTECLADPAYKSMIVETEIPDILYTPAVSGIPANFMRASLAQTGFDLTNPEDIQRGPDVGDETKAWTDVWSAGQGAHVIREVTSIANVVEDLRREYELA